MSGINDWNKLSDDDKNLIMGFVASNSGAVREMMRNKFPSLYIGRATDQVAKGWLMIAGLDEIKKFIEDFSK